MVCMGLHGNLTMQQLDHIMDRHACCAWLVLLSELAVAEALKLLQTHNVEGVSTCVQHHEMCQVAPGIPAW